MANNYTVISQVPDVVVLSPTIVVNAERVGIRTSPTGVYVEFPVDRASWIADQGEAVLSALATEVEALIASGLATTASFFNDLDENGLLIDYLDFVVEYTRPGGVKGLMSSVARVPVATLIGDSDPFAFNLAGNPREILTAAYDALVATASL